MRFDIMISPKAGQKSKVQKYRNRGPPWLTDFRQAYHPYFHIPGCRSRRPSRVRTLPLAADALLLEAVPPGRVRPRVVAPLRGAGVVLGVVREPELVRLHHAPLDGAAVGAGLGLDPLAPVPELRAVLVVAHALRQGPVDADVRGDLVPMLSAVETAEIEYILN